MDFAAANAGNDLTMLVFEDFLHLIIGVFRRFGEIQMGSLIRMNDRSAHIHGGFDSPLLPRLRLNVKYNAVVLDVSVKARHHQDTPRLILISLAFFQRMLTASHSPGKKKLDTLLSGFV